MNAKPASPTGARPAALPRTGVTAALDALRGGRPVIVVGDDNGEDQGNLVLAAELATAQSIAFLVRHTSGYVCVAASEERWEELQVPIQARCDDPLRTTFGVAVDATEGITTGISAHDRAHTISVLADPQSGPGDLTRPGHVVTVRARRGGVFDRRGHAEATVDLMRLAGLHPVGALCDVVQDDGPTAGAAELRTLSIEHDLVIVTIAELVSYRACHTATITRGTNARIPTDHGVFLMHGYQDNIDSREHLALVYGQPAHGTATLAYVHRECVIGDVFGSEKCACRHQLALALTRIAAAGAGVVIYLRGHDSGPGHVPSCPPIGEHDSRAAAHILRDLSISTIQLLTGEPDAPAELAQFGVTTEELLPLDLPQDPVERLHSVGATMPAAC